MTHCDVSSVILVTTPVVSASYGSFERKNLLLSCLPQIVYCENKTALDFYAECGLYPCNWRLSQARAASCVTSDKDGCA
jgi:hypothetical protein